MFDVRAIGEELCKELSAVNEAVGVGDVRCCRVSGDAALDVQCGQEVPAVGVFLDGGCPSGVGDVKLCRVFGDVALDEERGQEVPAGDVRLCRVFDNDT
jgi:hypothetical protein